MGIPSSSANLSKQFLDTIVSAQVRWHWPQEARLELCPFSVDYAVWIWNHFPDSTTRLSPIEVFTKAAFSDRSHLQQTRVFGCPVYVRAPTLQDAKKVPKWHKRSRKELFLGFSPQHHTNVALVLNHETGNITPQYHVVFDERFSTIFSNIHDNTASAVKLWGSLLEDGYDQHEAIKIPVHSSSDEILPSSQVHESPAPMETEVRSENSKVSPPESFPTDVTLTPCPEDNNCINS
jgi:hypothetical protein